MYKEVLSVCHSIALAILLLLASRLQQAAFDILAEVRHVCAK